MYLNLNPSPPSLFFLWKSFIRSFLEILDKNSMTTCFCPPLSCSRLYGSSIPPPRAKPMDVTIGLKKTNL